ncbi:MAG: AsmA-like C-terminal region-containing protein [Paracoccaceae bacterium]
MDQAQKAEGAAGAFAAPDAAVPSDPALLSPQDGGARGGPDAATAPRRRRRVVRVSLWSLAVLAVLAGVLVFAALALTGRPIRLPVWAVAEAEARANAALGPALPGGAVSLGGIEVMVDQDWEPRLRITDLRLMQGGGEALLVLPDLRLAFDGASALQGRLLPRDLRLTGARIAVRRDAQGRFDISLGAGQGAQLDSFAALLDAIDNAFAQPGLSRLERVEADALTLRMEDDRTGRSWEIGDGRLTLDNRADEVAAELSMSLVGGTSPARARLVAVSAKGKPLARVTASVEQIAAADLAAQAAPLGWLAALDAPLSGEISATLEGNGVSDLLGRFEIGAGALKPLPDTPPIAFSRAAVTLGYDQDRGRVNLTEIAVESPSLRLHAAGHADLVDGAGQPMTGALGGRLPAAFVTQIAFSKVMVDPAGVFETPVIFDQGAVDLRLRTDPFAVDVGQLSLTGEGDTHLSATGKVGAGPGGWTVAMDFAANHIGRNRLLQLWPVRLVAKTREWLDQNVLDGELSNLQSSLRLAPGAEPRLALSYDFSEGEVRFIKTLPPIRRAHGYATIAGKTYTMVVSRGEVAPPAGGPIGVSGSVFQVPDITRKPAEAQIHLLTDSTVTAALSLLDQPPFGFLTKADRPVDLAEGRAQMDTRLVVPLKPKVTPPEVDFTVAGFATGLRSDKLVPGKIITADRLEVAADRTGLRITGPGQIGAVGFDMAFSLPFGPEAKGRSHLEGTVELSPATVEEFDLGLPDGMVAGAGKGQVGIDFAKGEPGRMTLVSDLGGLALSLPDIGWSKGRDTRGRLEIAATLSKPPQVDRIAMDAAGLKAEGSIRLGANGLDTAQFGRVRIGGWLDAPVELHGNGKGRAPDIAVTGGQVDLRRLDSGGRGGKPAGGGTSITAALDRLIVSEGIALTGFRGRFSTRGGLNGNFTARVNSAAGAAVAGTVVPMNGGTGVRVQSDDAGATLAAAGIFSSAAGGSLDLQLVPRDAPQSYDGAATIRKVRVRNASVLAELLNAISVVGLLEQLNGEGIVFNQADASFVLTPERVVVTRGAAVGASLGVSLAGSYTMATKALDMQGVISPIYLLNGIGQIFSKRGEGLFGFNYRLRGTAGRPEISVNPLSILTPGMFREIFRQPPPGVKAGE